MTIPHAAVPTAPPASAVAKCATTSTRSWLNRPDRCPRDRVRQRASACSVSDPIAAQRNRIHDSLAGQSCQHAWTRASRSNHRPSGFLAPAQGTCAPGETDSRLTGTSVVVASPRVRDRAWCWWRVQVLWHAGRRRSPPGLLHPQRALLRVGSVRSTWRRMRSPGSEGEHKEKRNTHDEIGGAHQQDGYHFAEVRCPSEE